MVAHTGYLTFGRRIEPSDDARTKDLLAEQAGGMEEEQTESS
jgi:hypothetical protein